MLPVAPSAGRSNTFRFLVRLTANRPHVLSRQRSVARTAPLIIGWLLSSPPLRFSEIYLLVPSKRTLTYMAAPRGLEPRNPESESGVLPIRLKGNINEVALRSALFNRTYSLLLSTRRAYICSPITGVAGVVGFEPTQHTGSKPAALPTRLHPNICDY